jgi:hypothetical protein
MRSIGASGELGMGHGVAGEVARLPPDTNVPEGNWRSLRWSTGVDQRVDARRRAERTDNRFHYAASYWF